VQEQQHTTGPRSEVDPREFAQAIGRLFGDAPAPPKEPGWKLCPEDDDD
jgi:hypothetical protein